MKAVKLWVVRVFTRIFGFYRKRLPGMSPPTGAFVKMVTDNYLEAGSEFGDAVSCIYMGECVGFSGLHEAWETWEREYSSLGFRTLSVDDFVSIGGWGKDPQEVGFGEMRREGEKPVLHAKYYREHYLGKVRRHPAISAAFDGFASSGEYFLPTTDHLKKKA